MATLNIMDVSKWQGTINWDKVKASGKVDGVILRVLGSKGGKPYVDPTFEANYKACVERGIPVGAYYYSAATPPQCCQYRAGSPAQDYPRQKVPAAYRG